MNEKRNDFIQIKTSIENINNNLKKYIINK